MRLEALLGFTAVESTTEKEAINYVHTWGISTHCLSLPDYEENHQIALLWNKSHQKKEHFEPRLSGSHADVLWGRQGGCPVRKEGPREPGERKTRVKLPAFLFLHYPKKYFKGEILTCDDSRALYKEATYEAGREGRGCRHCNHMKKKTTTELQRPLAAVGAMGLGCRSRVWAGTSTCQQLPGLGHGAKTASPQCHPCTVGLAESISSINDSWVSLSWFCALFYLAFKKKK